MAHLVETAVLVPVQPKFRQLQIGLCAQTLRSGPGWQRRQHSSSQNAREAPRVPPPTSFFCSSSAFMVTS